MENIKYNSEDRVSHHGVAAVIKNTKNEILMQHHIKYGFWTIPVGKVKPNQTILQGLKQEIMEECNIKITKYKKLCVRTYKYIRDGNQVLVKGNLFEILGFTGEVKNNEPNKHSDQIFMPISKVIKLPYLSDLTLLYLETLGINRNAKI